MSSFTTSTSEALNIPFLFRFLLGKGGCELSSSLSSTTKAMGVLEEEDVENGVDDDDDDCGTGITQTSSSRVKSKTSVGATFILYFTFALTHAFSGSSSSSLRHSKHALPALSLSGDRGINIFFNLNSASSTQIMTCFAL